MAHAGRFPQLAPCKVFISIKTENCCLSQNSNWLIVQRAMETKAAMEDG